MGTIKMRNCSNNVKPSNVCNPQERRSKLVAIKHARDEKRKSNMRKMEKIINTLYPYKEPKSLYRGYDLKIYMLEDGEILIYDNYNDKGYETFSKLFQSCEYDKTHLNEHFTPYLFSLVNYWQVINYRDKDENPQIKVIRVFL